MRMQGNDEWHRPFTRFKYIHLERALGDCLPSAMFQISTQPMGSKLNRDPQALSSALMALRLLQPRDPRVSI